MKTLAFLLFASVITFLAGLTLVDARSPTEIPPARILSAALHGSANLKSGHGQLTKPENTFLRALETDDLCGAQKAYHQEYENLISAETLPGLLSSVGASPALQELFAANGVWFGEGAKPAHKLSRFYRALKLAKLIPLPGRENLSEARALLLALEKEEPGNGAYPYFRLSVERKLGFPRAQLKQTAIRVAHASYFDLLLLDHLREIETARWQSPTHYFLFTHFFENVIGGPNLGEPAADLRKLDRALHSAYGPATGELMVREGLRSTRGPHALGYHENTYAYGRSLLAKTNLPSFVKLARQKDDQPAGGFPALGEKCDRNAYETYARAIRNLL